MRRLEPAALAGVLTREIINFGSFWRSTTFSSTVEPTIYLLAFGFGFGSLVSEVAGYDYIEFVGTGIVATAVLFASAFPGIFSTLVKWRYQNTYSAILAAPVDPGELVAAEALWIAMRAGVYGCAPLLVAIAFGLDPTATALLVPGIAFVTGFVFACLGIMIAGIVKTFDNVNYVISAAITPMFLVAGTFFPVEGLPGWAATVAQVNPLYHCVELVRDAVFGTLGGVDLVHLGVLLGYALLLWRLAVGRMTRALID